MQSGAAMRVTKRVTYDIETMAVLDRDSYEYEGPVVLLKMPPAGKQAMTNAGFYQGQAADAGGQALAGYGNILAHPGYSEADKTAIQGATLGGLGASYQSSADEAGNRLARTRNSAGYGENLDELARSRGRDTAMAESGLQGKFADTALSERDKALQGMSGLYGIDAQTMAHLLGTAAGSDKPGFWGQLGGSVAKGLGGLIG